MLLEDKELDKVMSDLANIINPKAMVKLISHMSSIHRKVEDLRLSRDKWKIKHDEIKAKVLKTQIN